jgi:3-hydroxyacyl-[acyl-carrier-protein] dehydratase
MFSHIDQNISGIEFPEENFVFTDMFESLLRGVEIAGSKSSGE